MPTAPPNHNDERTPLVTAQYPPPTQPEYHPPNTRPYAHRLEDPFYPPQEHPPPPYSGPTADYSYQPGYQQSVSLTVSSFKACVCKSSYIMPLL